MPTDTPIAGPSGPSGSHQAHARLSPSGSKCWSNCTAAPSYQEANNHRVPNDDSSRYSTEGTEAHDWAAKVLMNEITIEDVPFDPENGIHFRPYVKAYVEHCLSLVPDGVEPLIEVSVPLWYQPDENGTMDFGVATSDRVTVRDLKYGQGVLVDADENPQLAIYAYSLIRQLQAKAAEAAELRDIMGDEPDANELTFGPATIVDIGVFQPRHREAADAQPWVITLSDLELFCKDIEYKAMQANAGLERVRKRITKGDVSAKDILEWAPGLKFAPSEGDSGACRWCKCKAFCEKRFENNTEGLDLPELSVEELLASMPDLDKDEKKLPVDERLFAQAACNRDMLTDDYLVSVYAKQKAITAWLKDVEEYLESRALAGNGATGTKLVMGREGNRAWVDEDAAEVFLKGQKLKQEERFDFKLKSPTKIEELLKDKLSPRAKTRFGQLISRSSAKPVLALASDKRDAVDSPLTSLPDLDQIAEEELLADI